MFIYNYIKYLISLSEYVINTLVFWKGDIYYKIRRSPTKY
jgi:hypothetical protein